MKTQGSRLIAHLKRRPMTYLDMLMLGISTCPHKRVAESLREGELLAKGYTYVNGRRLLRWRVVTATKWTA